MPRRHPSPLSYAHSRTACGFSLLELLIVIAIIAILSVLALPAISSLGTSQNLTKTSEDIGSILTQARTYAMANNTYVYVGLYETNEIAGALGGTGKIYIGVAASSDGSSGITGGSWTPNLSGITHLQAFDNVHLISSSETRNTLTNMDANTSGADLDLASLSSQTQFSGTSLGRSAALNPVTLFTKVIQFNPAGSANIVTNLMNTEGIPPYIQIAFVPSHGNQPSTSLANCAGIQIDGVTGAVRVFRP
jgi:prepilin-type N-terminal cleavage/methylation domain-containing protein